MKNQSLKWAAMIAGMLMLILDAKTAAKAAGQGIDICLKTVIPALFPFFILSSMINAEFTGRSSAILRPIGRLFRIPEGMEAILILGLLGGYPVGAQSICEAYKQGSLQKKDAHRMLGFCSNAGPSFIFGMAGTLFGAGIHIWILWIIHIAGALVSALLLPGEPCGSQSSQSVKPLSLPQALDKSIKNMASVCGWVILFRVIILFLERWILWYAPSEARITLTGFLELSNGIVELMNLDIMGAKFLLCAALLGFGGLCVLMQTVSAVGELGLGLYLPGKILHCVISFLLAYPIQFLLLPPSQICHLHPLFLLLTILFPFMILMLVRKKTVAFPGRVMYNNQKNTKRTDHAV